MEFGFWSFYVNTSFQKRLIKTFELEKHMAMYMSLYIEDLFCTMYNSEQGWQHPNIIESKYFIYPEIEGLFVYQDYVFFSNLSFFIRYDWV